MEETKLNISSK